VWEETKGGKPNLIKRGPKNIGGKKGGEHHQDIMGKKIPGGVKNWETTQMEPIDSPRGIQRESQKGK